MIRVQDSRKRSALSLLELLAVLTLLGAIAAIVIPRIGSGAQKANSTSCDVNRNVIEIQAALWHRERGSWPASSLSDVGTDQNFFPEGVPLCPVDGSPYTIDPATGRVRGHIH